MGREVKEAEVLDDTSTEKLASLVGFELRLLFKGSSIVFRSYCVIRT